MGEKVGSERRAIEDMKLAERKKVGRFVLVGVAGTLFDFAIYTVLSRTLLQDKEWLWLVSLISAGFATILNYFLHKNITWKGRGANFGTVTRFLGWNGVVLGIVRPVLIWLFGSLTRLYGWAFMVSSWLRLPFTLDFITKTGIFGLAAVVVMVINFLGYEKFVFREKI